MAISRVQYPTPYASSAKSTTHSLSWTSTTAAGSLLLCCVGWNEEASTVTQSLSGGSGSWTLLTGTPVEKTTTGLGQLKGAIYYKENATAQSGAVTLTLSASHHATIHLVEYSGVALSSSLDQTATNSGSTTTPSTGTTSTTTTAAELWAGFVVAKNVNANTTPTNSFTLVGDAGQGSGGGAAEHSAYLEKIVAGTGTAGSGTTISVSADWVGMIATFKAASAGATLQFTATGAAGAPRSFPLGPPDMTGATPITDTSSTKDTAWTPTDPSLGPNQGLKSGVDYIINCPFVRSRRMLILGGRNVYVPQYLMKFAAATPLSGAPDGWMLGVQGGDVGGIIHFDTVHLDNNQLQCDGFKSFKDVGSPNFHPGGSFARTVQIRNCVVEKLVGRSTSSTGAAVHADLFQTSGGAGDIWIEDFTGSTEYDGFMFQQEANCEDQTTYWGVSAAVSDTPTAGTYKFTTVAGTSGTTSTHTLLVGDSVVVYDVADSNTAWYGGFTITAVTSNTFTVLRGDTASPGALPAGARVVKIDFAYIVGSHNFNRVNVKGFTNELTGGASNQAIRFGARTAPQPNLGNAGNNPPAFTLGLPLGHVNEDETPLNYTAWGGTLTATNWYGEPDAGTIANWVEPDSSTNNYSVVRPTQHAAAGGQPAYASWDNHPQVSAGTKFQQGPPPGGDYVSINSSGIPVPRIANPAGGAGVTEKTITGDARIAVQQASAFPNAYDTFTRSVGAGGLGTADLGGSYTLLGTAADFSVNGTQADIALTAVNTRRATLTNLTMIDQYLTATMQTDTFPAVSYTAFDVYLRFVDTNNWFRCRVALYPSGLVQIRWDRNLAGSNTTIKAFATVTGLTATANADYTILASAVGSSGTTTLNATVYDASAPAPLPVPVQVSASDTAGALQVSSSAGIGGALNTGSTATTTDVLITDWGVWPTRLTSTTSVATTTASAAINVPTFNNNSGFIGSKHRWTPR